MSNLFLHRIIDAPAAAAGYDADAQAFITAAALTVTADKNAINQLVLDLKSKGLWSMMYALYPFVGSTTAGAYYNLMNPANTDAAYRLTSGSTPASLTPKGMAFTGIDTQWLDTHFIPTVAWSGTSENHCSVYVTEAGSLGSTQTELSASDAGQGLYSLHTGIGGSAYFENSTGGGLGTAVPTAAGFTLGSRLNGNTSVLAKNGAIINSSGQSFVQFPGLSLYLGNRHKGAGTDTLPSGRTLGLVSLGKGLTTAQISDFYTLVQAYQTSLGRQV